ncbi:hypothetical protein [Paenibacillus elgii]|uniref:hypothetical protein n=1 Tax=Paenibacillus elgii TaxID=189691 RepID=UPI00210036E2|nr:hypothetical protein [Paenibacillus elgii]
MEVGIKARIEAALQLAGLGKNGLQVSYLAEGAWHEAYLISTTETGPLVVRFPKPFSYGKPFVYNERELRAEYGGRGLYYRLANGVSEGICPQYYTYYVSPELSFTIETYSGPVMSLAAANEAEAARWGAQCGRFFRNMDQVSVELEGFGFLDWKAGKLAGDHQQDFRAYWVEDTEGYLGSWERLERAGYGIEAVDVKRMLEEIVPFRLRRTPRLSLTNRDVSPENLIICEAGVRLIDPVPIVYDGFAFTGNVLNNFNTLFPSFHRSPRYERHRFDRYRPLLGAFADGVLEGYAQGDPEMVYALRVEQYLMLLDLTCDHIGLLEREMTEEAMLRYGDKAAVEERIPGYIADLEQFRLS